LGESALEALLGLADGSPEGRPHVFLFGEASLIDRLDQLCAEAQTEGERYHVIELAPYTEDETREYLEQRLEGAGQGIELFTAEQITDIHEHSGGWPGAINQVARDSMIEAMIASRSAVKRPSVGFKMPKKYVMALGAVVAVGVLAAVLIPGRGGNSGAPATQPANSQAQLPLGQGTPSAQQSNNGGPAIEFAGNSQPMPLPLVGNSQPVMRGPLAEAAGASDGDDDGVPVGSVDQPPTVTTTAPPAGVPAGAAPSTPRSSIAPPAAATAPKPTAPAATAPKSAAPAQAPTQVATAKTAPAAAGKSAAGSSWYGSQAPGRYVVQILGTSSESTAQAFVAEQGGEYRYFKKTLQGKPLYVITYGNFSDRAAALAAIKVLPAKVQAGKPWPRTVASIQQELGAAR
ncbi:SPOR domain-containing protein, partial [Pseudomonas quasicaspiana]|nr:SPOR domain-containing protein [Pseudomonas quasicaspiana]